MTNREVEAHVKMGPHRWSLGHLPGWLLLRLSELPPTSHSPISWRHYRLLGSIGKTFGNLSSPHPQSALRSNPLSALLWMRIAIPLFITLAQRLKGFPLGSSTQGVVELVRNYFRMSTLSLLRVFSVFIICRVIILVLIGCLVSPAIVLTCNPSVISILINPWPALRSNQVCYLEIPSIF